MDKLKETKDSIFNKIITIPFDKNDSNRSMKQAIEEYLKDTIVKAKEYSSALNVMGIFSMQKIVLLKIGFTIAWKASKGIQLNCQQTG